MFLFVTPDQTPLVKNANIFRTGFQVAKGLLGRGATAPGAVRNGVGAFGYSAPKTAPTLLSRLHHKLSAPISVPGVNWQNAGRAAALGSVGSVGYGMGYAGGAQHGATQALHQFMQGVEQQPWWERLKLGAGLAAAPGRAMDAIVERMRSADSPAMARTIGNQLYTWRRAAEGPPNP